MFDLLRFVRFLAVGDSFFSAPLGHKSFKSIQNLTKSWYYYICSICFDFVRFLAVGDSLFSAPLGHKSFKSIQNLTKYLYYYICSICFDFVRFLAVRRLLFKWPLGHPNKESSTILLSVISVFSVWHSSAHALARANWHLHASPSVWIKHNFLCVFKCNYYLCTKHKNL